jgi:energy-coupling factor transporter transmembrane protein EcfT
MRIDFINRFTHSPENAMPSTLKFLCSLFGALNLAKLATLGFNILQSKDDRLIVWAAGVYAALILLLFALLICFAERKGKSLTLLRVVVSVIVVCQFVFYFSGWLTPFQEASSLLKVQQLFDWGEVVTCIALAVVLRLQSTKSWYAPEPFNGAT